MKEFIYCAQEELFLPIIKVANVYAYEDLNSDRGAYNVYFHLDDKGWTIFDGELENEKDVCLYRTEEALLRYGNIKNYVLGTNLIKIRVWGEDEEIAHDRLEEFCFEIREEQIKLIRKIKNNCLIF